MVTELKSRLIFNKFVDGVRISLIFDDAAYEDLRLLLRSLAQDLHGDDQIDKELALVLYTMPVIVRNMYLSCEQADPKSDLTSKLEDARVELDALVLACLAD